ncbi:MAG: hypothetical protein AAF849_24760 [Bacteroidota bacterium]
MLDLNINVNGTGIVGSSKSFVIKDRKVHELSIGIKYISKGQEFTNWIPAKYWTKANSRLVIPKNSILNISGDLRTNTWKKEDGTTAKEVYLSIRKLDVIKWGEYAEPKPKDKYDKALAGII